MHNEGWAQSHGLNLRAWACTQEQYAWRALVSETRSELTCRSAEACSTSSLTGRCRITNPTCEGLHSMVAEKHGTSHLHSISPRISCILSRGRSILSRSCWPSGHLAPLGCPALCCLQHKQEGYVFQAVGSAAMYTCPMQRCLCMHSAGQSCMSDGPGSMLRPVNSIRCTQLRNTAGSP